MSRPLTRYNEIRAKAELNYKDRIRELEQELRVIASQSAKIRSASGGAGVSPEQKRLLREYRAKTAQIMRELKEVRKQLRSDLNKLDTRLRLINMAGVPLAVALAGLIWACFRFSKRRRRA